MIQYSNHIQLKRRLFSRYSFGLSSAIIVWMMVEKYPFFQIILAIWAFNFLFATVFQLFSEARRKKLLLLKSVDLLLFSFFQAVFWTGICVAIFEIMALAWNWTSMTFGDNFLVDILWLTNILFVLKYFDSLFFAIGERGYVPYKKVLNKGAEMAQSNKMIAAIAAQKERFAILGVGFLGDRAIVLLVNYGIDPALVAYFGVFVGGVAVTIVSFFICLATIIFYDWAKKDWLGIELLKELKEYEGDNRLGRVVRWFLHKGDLVALFGLSIITDPFITTVYLRKGANQYNGMGRREWKIFLASTIIGNIYWVMVVFGAINIFSWIVLKISSLI